MSGRSHCPGCGRNNRDPRFPYCRNCSKKLGGRPARKQVGQCAYGRCHRGVAANVFGMPVFRYCPLHQSQYESGVIRGRGPRGHRL